MQVQTVSAPPGGTTGTSNGLREPVSLADTSGALAGRCKTTQLTMLLDCLADPVDLGVTTDSVVRWVDQDNFKVFV